MFIARNASVTSDTSDTSDTTELKPEPFRKLDSIIFYREIDKLVHYDRMGINLSLLEYNGDTLISHVCNCVAKNTEPSTQGISVGSYHLLRLLINTIPWFTSDELFHFEHLVMNFFYHKYFVEKMKLKTIHNYPSNKLRKIRGRSHSFS